MNSRNLTIGVMAVLTLVLGIIAVVIGLQLQNSQAPDDEFVAGSGGAPCLYSCLPLSQCGGTNLGKNFSNCAADEYCCTETITPPPPPPPPPSNCDITQPGGLNGCIVASGDCSLILETYNRPMTGPSDECFTSDNGSTQVVGPGTYCPTPSQCNCQQVDIVRDSSGNPVGPFGAKAGNWSDSCSNNPPPPPPPPPGPLASCGESCGSTSDCQSSFVCDSGICKLPVCLTPGACSDGACIPVNCGDGKIDAGEECGEPGLSCGVGEVCVTNSCVCVNNQCGNSCNSDNECPTGHSCAFGRCRLDICISDPSSCSVDGCAHIPQTALISDEVDRVLLALAALVIGLVLFKYRVVDRFGGQLQLLFDGSEGEVNLRLGRKPRTYESKYAEKVAKEFEN